MQYAIPQKYNAVKPPNTAVGAYKYGTKLGTCT